MTQKFTLVFTIFLFTTISLMAQKPIVSFSFDNTLNDTTNTFAFTPSTALTGSGWGFATNRFGEANKAFACTNNSNRSLTANITSLPQGNSARTIEFWYKFNSSSSPNFLVAYGSNITSQGYGITQESNKIINYGWANDIEVAQTFTVGVWYHYAIVYDGVTAYIYRNGLFLTSAAKYWNTIGTNLLIGSTPSLLKSFNGTIDDLRIYDVELGLPSIQYLYNNAKNLPSPPYKWNFNNSYSDTTNQMSFSSNAGTSFVNDRFGNANSAININNTGCTATIFGLPYHKKPRSISFWVKHNVVIGSPMFNMWYSYGKSGTNYANGGGYHQLDGIYHFGYLNNHATTISSPLLPNQWYHIVFVFDGTLSKIYSNGTLLSSQTMTGWNTLGIDDVFKLGIGIGNEISFNGAIDDLRIMNKALTDAEVSALYASESTLPMQLHQFSAQLKNNTTLLKWSTATEVNTSHFEIEYSNNGKEFTTVGTVAAKGNSSNLNAYNFTHNVNNQSMHYYRLKMIDNDAKFEYSNIVKLKTTNKFFDAIVYPTIANNTITASITAKEKANATIELFGMNGNKVLQKTVSFVEGSQTYNINIAHLIKGSYIVSIKAGNNVQSSRIIIQ